MPNGHLRRYLMEFLKSSYLQTEFIKTMPSYIRPIRCEIESINKSYFYIPIKQILEKYVLNEELIRIIDQETPESVTPYIKDNGFCNKLQIVIYGDEFGITNPLRESSRKYKVYALYLDIGNYKRPRTKLKDIHLLMIWCPNDQKNANKSFAEILSPRVRI
ncbi:hypothetical protein BLA29_010790 [Euroglyphus maynei]|uniref:Uncharacterized protein n=1 Tax=Euroglyphus maynei TaxID=6958 RepID=A0A1Y3AWL6_EURMA|nr:hypothetical protein BLA29_010790 [Euroglyphus maynei]